MEPLTILHKDRDQVVVEKPYGLLSVPGVETSDSVQERLQAQGFPTAISVHRLDMLTSGIIIFALRKSAERELKRQFRERLVEKEYVTWVTGIWAEDKGLIDLPLSVGEKDPQTGWPKHRVDLENGKKAETAFEVIRRTETSSLLRLIPKTGRSHQLRVHCAEKGHPLVGDPIYGKEIAERMYLHACLLKWIHPYNQAPMEIQNHPAWAS